MDALFFCTNQFETENLDFPAVKLAWVCYRWKLPDIPGVHILENSGYSWIEYEWVQSEYCSVLYYRKQADVLVTDDSEFQCKL